MALTQVKTTGLADDAVTSAKIADDAIAAAGIADNAVVTAGINADAVTGAKIADDAIDSEHYTDGSIDTAHIADDQVTLAKMAGLARGKLIYGDSSGNPAALTVGSANQVLTADGTDVAWAAAAGGGKILQVVTATNTSNVSVTGSTYSTFITADITPTAASSKFLVLITTGVYVAESGSHTVVGFGWSMTRNIGGSSVVGLIADPLDSQGPYGHYFSPGADHHFATISTKIGFDSPNTTSTVTYLGEGRPYKDSGMSANFGSTSDSQIFIIEVDGS